MLANLDRRIVDAVVARMEDKAASGLDRPAAQHPTASARGGRRIASVSGTMSSCTRSLPKSISSARWLMTMPMAPSSRWAHI